MKTVLKSFSKLNLSLRVFQIQANGLHPISSIFQEISLHDLISISVKPSTSPSLHLTSSGIPIPLNQSNILVSLFESIKDKLNHDYEIHLHKNIPTGSGMGGASSNAACVLNYMIEIESLSMSTNDVVTLAHSIGSDIPFFIHGEQQHVLNTGETCTPLSNSTASSYVIIYPAISCSTPQIYQHFDTLNPKAPIYNEATDSLNRNDLLPVVLDLYPDMKHIYDNISALLKRPVHLTGSGSTFFVPLTNPENQTEILNALHAAFPSYLIQAVNTIKRPSYYRVTVSGTVQGVFYRASTQKKAQELSISGWVKNDNDGCVSMCISGSESACRAMIDWCHIGPKHADVEHVDVKAYPLVMANSEFEIR